MNVVPLPDWEDPVQRALLRHIEGGLPLTARPYRTLGEALGLSEQEVIARLRRLQEQGAIKRFGVVVRHRELGYCANAMVVWDVPDAQVRALGSRLGGFACVTLCYRRPRRLPGWPYNLFTMIHGRDRSEVLERLRGLVEACGLQGMRHEVLFSRRRFKQRGARYASLCADAPPRRAPRLLALDSQESA